MTALEKATQVVTGAMLDAGAIYDWNAESIARAVLMAVRTPDSETRHAGLQELPWGKAAPSTAGKCFADMIDAILAEKPE